MKQRRKLLPTLLLLAVAVLTGTFFLWPRGPREPVYQGKTLARWINGAHDVGIFEQTDETKAALNAIGTNAVPFLLHEFTSPLSGWRREVNAWSRRHPGFKLRVRDYRERLTLGTIGLMLLETNAAPAIPVLIRCLDEPVRGHRAAVILQNLGDAVVPPLMAQVLSTNRLAASNALAVLRNIHSRPDAGRAALDAALRHPDPNVRVAALHDWRSDVGNRADAVPALLQLTRDPSPLVVREAIEQLEELKANSFQNTRAAASNALLTLRTHAPPPRAP